MPTDRPESVLHHEQAAVDPAKFLALGREVLAAQPFSVLLGAELVAQGTITRLPAKEDA